MEKKTGGVRGDKGTGLGPGNDDFMSADNGKARMGNEPCSDQTGRATDLDSPQSNTGGKISSY